MEAIPTRTQPGLQQGRAESVSVSGVQKDTGYPIPVWDTATHPAEWEEYEDVNEGHSQVLGHVTDSLKHLVSPAWHIVPERGIYFIDATGHLQRVIPDLAVYPRHLADASGALRYDVPSTQQPPPPLWILEIASPSTFTRDLQDKKAWYVHIGVKEYWLCDPVGGLLQPPLQGWCRTAGASRYTAQSVAWDKAAQFWVSFSPLLEQEVLMPDTQPEWSWAHTYHGMRFRDPTTGQLAATHQELEILSERQQDTIQQFQRQQQSGIVFMAEMRYGKPWDDRVQEALQQCPPTSWPDLDQVREWMRQRDDALDCLNVIRAYLDLPPWTASGLSTR